MKGMQVSKKSRKYIKGTHSEGSICWDQLNRDLEIDIEKGLQEEDNIFVTGSCKQSKELILLNNDSREQEIYEENLLVEEEID